MANVEKLTALCQSSYSRIYEDDEAALARLRLTLKDVEELSEFDSSFREYLEGLESARAVLEDLSFALRDFADKLEFSPARLATIEDRLAELSRLKRKYGGSIETAMEHLALAQDRLRQIETSDEREQQLNDELAAAHKVVISIPLANCTSSVCARQRRLIKRWKRASLKSQWRTRGFRFR